MTSRLTPRLSARAEALLWLTAAALLLLWPGQVGAAGAANPHQFMEEENSCGRCHRQIPPRGEYGDWVMEVDSICGDCHERAGRLLHPMEIRPRIHFDMPLPLDYEGRITCVTCHDPHSEPYADVPYVKESPLLLVRKVVFRQAHRTYFLRMPNDRGQICSRCHDGRKLSEQVRSFRTPPKQDYRGSLACSACHGREYLEWSRTAHARCLQNPATTPGALEAAFAGSESISREDIVRTIGVHWTQRYLVVRSAALMTAREVWSLTESRWAPEYWGEQPWREQCAGCHYTGYNPYLDTLVEEGVGCECCHGPGGRHVDSGRAEDIVNPSRLPGEARAAVCAACHTRGHDRTGEFLYPVGYVPGQDLEVFYRGLIPRRGQGTDTFRDDGTLEDRLRSLEFWMERFLKEPGVECAFGAGRRTSGDGIEKQGDPTLARYCLSCHGARTRGDSRPAACRQEDENCYRCHDPLRDDHGLPSIHDHKFVFGQTGDLLPRPGGAGSGRKN